MNYEDRRMILVPIDMDAVAKFIQSPNETKIIEGLPKTAKPIGVNYSPERQCFLFCFEDDSFEPTPMGEPLPIINITTDSLVISPILEEDE